MGTLGQQSPGPGSQCPFWVSLSSAARGVGWPPLPSPLLPSPVSEAPRYSLTWAVAVCFQTWTVSFGHLVGIGELVFWHILEESRQRFLPLGGGGECAKDLVEVPAHTFLTTALCRNTQFPSVTSFVNSRVFLDHSFSLISSCSRIPGAEAQLPSLTMKSCPIQQLGTHPNPPTIVQCLLTIFSAFPPLSLTQ